MHPVIEEIVRCKGPADCRPEVFRRWQQQLRDEIAPLLDELAAYKVATSAMTPIHDTRRERRA